MGGISNIKKVSMKMISLYSTWWVKPGNEKAITVALNKLAKEVRENEKGTLMYLVHTPVYDYPKAIKGKKSIKSAPEARPGTIIFVEKYENWDAFQVHLYGPYFTTFVKEYKSMFVLNHDEEPFVEVVFMEEIVGVIKQ
jgi:quinol monooxygenase YgiN